MSIPLRAVSPPAASGGHYEAPYRAYLLSALAVGLGGGFLLAILLPLAGALQWDWGTRYEALVQAHGQLNLIGFAGMFSIGVALRIAPRFSGRAIPWPRVVLPMLALTEAGLVVQAVALPAASGVSRNAALVVAAVAFIAGTGMVFGLFARMLAHRESRAEATGWFFVAGTFFLFVSSVLNAQAAWYVVRDDLPLAPLDRHASLVFAQQFGFIMMFICGVTLRAVTTFTGRPRPVVMGKVCAVALSGAAVMLSVSAQWMAVRGSGPATARLMDAGFTAIGVVFIYVAWASGALRPGANRVAAASQAPFVFVRSAIAWLAAGGVLLIWYAAGAFRDGRAPDAFETDTFRHVLTLGVTTMMIVGMAMLIIPEFAGRRLQHPDERLLTYALALAMNLAVMLRVWPSVRGLEWLQDTRYWPMSAAGALATAVLLIFAAMFLQSWREQRTPGWATPEALKAR